MNFKNALLSLSLFGVIFSSSCKKEIDDTSSNNTDETVVNVPQDKENVAAGLKQMVSCISDYKNGKFIQGIVAFNGIANGESQNDEWVSETVGNLINKIALGTANQYGDYEMDEASDFQFTIGQIKGIYTYSSTTKDFSVASSSANELVVKLPSAPSVSYNNVVLTFSKYEFSNYTFDGEQVPLPTSVYLSVSIDGEKAFEIDLKSAKYVSKADYAYPTSLDLVVYTNPYSIAIDYTKSGNVFDVSYKMTSASTCPMEFTGKLVLAHDDLDNIDEDGLISAEVLLSYGSLKVVGKSDLKTLIALGDPTVAQVNQYSDVKMFVDNAEIGEYSLELDSDDEAYLNMIYKDGTTDNMQSKYLDAFVSDLEVELSDMTGSWD